MKVVHPEDLLVACFEGTLNEAQKAEVEAWRKSSEENQQIFADSFKTWQGIEHLRRMKKYKAEKALQKVHAQIAGKGRGRVLSVLQKAAAVLILPLMAATVYFASQSVKEQEENVVWYTLNTPAGMRSEFILPDSTKVYLNSETSLSYPATFSAQNREVNLIGEAYFEVKENKEQPFIVNTGKIDIEVTGTRFKASNYENEKLTEIVLVSGSVNLCLANSTNTHHVLTRMEPGEKALYDAVNNKLNIERVNVDKYISWKDGILMFRDDPMIEVVRRLNRWFNVEINFTGNGLSDYVYTATFEDESLMQILDLLKVSAPIDYKIKKRQQNADKTFSKMEIEIIQR